METRKISAWIGVAILLWVAVALSQPMSFDWYPSQTSGNGICVEKVSGDDYRDIVASNSGNGSYCWFNHGAQAPATFYSAIPFTASGWDAKFGQLRAGAPKDLGLSVIGTITTYLNDNNTLTFQQTINQGACYWISWGKVNNDAFDDLAGGGLNQNFVYVYHNLGNGFLNASPALVDVGGLVRKLELANLLLNYQVHLCDLIVGGNGLVKIYGNNGSGSFAWRQTIDFGSGYPIYEVDDFAVGDVNRDYYNDLVVCNTDDRRIRTYLNNGDGTFDDVNYLEVNEFFYTHQIALGEINYDGYPDLALATDDYMIILHNEGDGNFNPEDPQQVMLPMPGIDMATEELILADLVGHGAMSISGTGLATGGPGYGFYVFKDLGDPAPCPVRHFTIIPDPNNHPILQWL